MQRMNDTERWWKLGLPLFVGTVLVVVLWPTEEVPTGA